MTVYKALNVASNIKSIVLLVKIERQNDTIDDEYTMGPFATIEEIYTNIIDEGERQENRVKNIYFFYENTRYFLTHNQLIRKD